MSKRRRSDVLQDLVSLNQRMLMRLSETEPEKLSLSGYVKMKGLLDELAASDRTTDPMPDHDGQTYEAPFDKGRLNGQLRAVYEVMVERWPGRWFTLSELTEITSDISGKPYTEAAISARIRDLRKTKFGSFSVESKRVDGGLWVYRVIRLSDT